MRKLLFVLMTGVIFVSCSTPKYTYKFDRYSVKHTVSQTKNNVDFFSQDSNSEEKLNWNSEIATASSSVVNQTQTIVASISKDIYVQPGKVTTSAVSNPNSSFTKIAKKERKGLVSAIKQYNAFKKTSPDAVKEGVKSKNGFAIAGFFSSIVGLIVLWPLCIVGIILSAIGMKSEKRGLAIAGLIIGIVGVAIILAVGV